MSYYEQKDFNIRCEWGLKGVEILSPISEVIIIIDILSFSTCVEIATNNGSIVFPYRYKDETAEKYALEKEAILADKRSHTKYSLSPSSLLKIPDKTKIVLPSPNGSTLSLSTGKTTTIIGCFRNFESVAKKALTLGKNISIIPAGEKWEDGSLRPALEDFICAGAIISLLEGTLSPESEIAKKAFLASKDNLKQLIKNCISGRELIEKEFEKDVALALEMNVSNCVPILKDNYYSKF